MNNQMNNARRAPLAGEAANAEVGGRTEFSRFHFHLSTPPHAALPNQCICPLLPPSSADPPEDELVLA